MESMCADQDKSDAMNNNINNHYSLIWILLEVYSYNFGNRLRHGITHSKL